MLAGLIFNPPPRYWLMRNLGKRRAEVYQTVALVAVM